MARNGTSGWIYVLDSDIEAHRDDETRIYKIGRASNLSNRIKQLSTAYAYRPVIAYTFHSHNYIQDEVVLHELFANKRLNGEWFRLDYSDIGFIANYAEFNGFYEATDGSFVPDPCKPYVEEEAVKMAELELSQNKHLARKHFQLGQFDLTSDFWAFVEDGLSEPASSLDKYEKEDYEEEDYDGGDDYEQ